MNLNPPLTGMIAAMPMPGKGDRHPHTVRVPMDQHRVYRAAAVRAGMDYGSYLVWALAHAHGLEPTEEPRTSRQPMLLQLDQEDGAMAS